MGLQVVNDTLANNYIQPDESMKAQAIVKDRGRHTFIDKVKVRLVDSDYWAEVTALMQLSLTSFRACSATSGSRRGVHVRGA